MIPSAPLVRRRRRIVGGTVGVVCAVLFGASRGYSQVPDSVPPPSTLKQLSLEQLMDIEVTSVSKRPEKLTETASAIQVITGEAIRRSGATSLPEALRLAPNLQVAQVNSSQWAISARGFTNVLSNKLLVLIDGRTVYTPLYAGVFWDVQNPPLEEIDRIEVISGPGGALWGANAVNGVINIITRSATETRGFSGSGGAGTEARGFGYLRYGGRLGSNLHGRVYAEAFGRDNSESVTGPDARDAWHMAQGGFRLDGNSGANNLLTLQGDVYDGRPDPDGGNPVLARGGNALGRWTHTISESSNFQLQLYYDRTYRDFRNDFTEDLATYDVDWQHGFRLGKRQQLTWGLGARLMDHTTTNLQLFAFLPEHRLLHLYSGFLQDEITLVENRLRLTLGSKLEHNDYTHWEVQPSARLTWTPREIHTFWAAVSRAVRTPSRIDRDFFLSIAPGVGFIVGDDIQSEEVLAYELGWRVRPDERLSLSLATFYNVYDNIRSAEPGPPPSGIPITFENGVKGNSYGAELAATYQVSNRWQLRGGYSFLKKDLSIKPGSNDLNRATAESDDPEHQFLIQSTADLTSRLLWDVVFRVVGELPDPKLPAYAGLDLRLGWKLTPRLEVAVVGQNLLKAEHREFIAGTPPRAIERGVYAKVTWH
jgi:iron complex outermembrane recepter protein